MRKVKISVLLFAGLILAGCEFLPQLPSPPAEAPSLSASFGKSLDSIELSWVPVAGASEYKIFRAQERDGEYLFLASTQGTTYLDRVGGENQGKWYWYRVQACNSAGCGPFSEPARGYAGRPPKPQAPKASDGTYSDKILIVWEEVPGASSYQVFRDPSPQPGCQGLCFLAETDKNSYEDKNVRAGIRYRYAVRACNNFGCSELSGTDTGCVSPCPLPFSLDAE